MPRRDRLIRIKTEQHGREMARKIGSKTRIASCCLSVRNSLNRNRIMHLNDAKRIIDSTRDSGKTLFKEIAITKEISGKLKNNLLRNVYSDGFQQRLHIEHLREALPSNDSPLIAFIPVVVLVTGISSLAPIGFISRVRTKMKRSPYYSIEKNEDSRFSNRRQINHQIQNTLSVVHAFLSSGAKMSKGNRREQEYSLAISVSTMMAALLLSVFILLQWSGTTERLFHVFASSRQLLQFKFLNYFSLDSFTLSCGGIWKSAFSTPHNMSFPKYFGFEGAFFDSFLHRNAVHLAVNMTVRLTVATSTCMTD